jgi:hypothetical protein
MSSSLFLGVKRSSTEFLVVRLEGSVFRSPYSLSINLKRLSKYHPQVLSAENQKSAIILKKHSGKVAQVAAVRPRDAASR